MTNIVSRLVWSLAALLLAGGGAMHAAAYGKAAGAIAGATNLPSFYGHAFEGLWLIDSATLIVVAAITALLAVRPALAAKPVVVLLALIPAATAGLLYAFVGSFLPGHILIASAALMVVGAVARRSPRPNPQTAKSSVEP